MKRERARLDAYFLIRGSPDGANARRLQVLLLCH
jgi:hypothetical protein